MATSSALAALPNAVPRASRSSTVSMAIRRRGALSPGLDVPRQPPLAARPCAIVEPASPKPISAMTRGDKDILELSPDLRSGRFAVVAVARRRLGVARTGDP